MTPENLRAIAAEARAKDSLPKGGYVLIFDGEAFGWKGALDRAETVRPGVFAVSENGTIFEAFGGDEETGAEAFRKVDAQP